MGKFVGFFIFGMLLIVVICFFMGGYEFVKMTRKSIEPKDNIVYEHTCDTNCTTCSDKIIWVPVAGKIDTIRSYDMPPRGMLVAILADALADTNQYISWLAILHEAGWEFTRKDEEIVNWFTTEGAAAWPDTMVGVIIRVEFDVEVIRGGDLEFHPEWRLMLPHNVTDGRIFLAPITENSETGDRDTLSFGREVEVLTGIPTAHWGGNRDWHPILEDPE